MKGISSEDLGHLIGRLLVRVPLYLIVFFGLILPAFRYWTQ